MPTNEALAHIPHLPTTPVVGHTLDFLRDPLGLHTRSIDAFGPIYKVNVIGQWRVSLGAADALEFILGDTDHLFSSHHGWDVLHRLFPGGLMLRDFDDHRRHRRIMQAAFRKIALDAYRDEMQRAFDQLVDDLPANRRFRFYPAMKEMTLKMGASVFMGLPLDDPRTAKLNAAFAAEVAASLAPIRVPLPFTAMGRGVRARTYLRETFRSMIVERRQNGGHDFFSQMCQAVDDDGTSWTADEILDHFNFLMMAAHDTTASSLAKVIWALGAYPEWQDRVRAEIDALPDGPLQDETLASLDVTNRVFREALRLLPPVPFIPRRAERAFEYGGTSVPAGTWVSAIPALVMASSEYWTEPGRFDPDRFSPNRAEDRSHKYAWAPFGGGAHKCIGLHFATIQVKLFLVSLLRRYRVELENPMNETWAQVPIPKPNSGLPLRLVARA